MIHSFEHTLYQFLLPGVVVHDRAKLGGNQALCVLRFQPITPSVWVTYQVGHFVVLATPGLQPTCLSEREKNPRRKNGVPVEETGVEA